MRLIKTSASKWCDLDPLPTPLLKECLTVLLPVITKIVHLSLSTSTMLENMKKALLLYWLPVKFRVNFKILQLTFKAYHGFAPSFLFDLIDMKLSTYSLRNYDDFLLVEPRTKLKMYGDRAFSKAAPFLWNPLPINIRNNQNVACFKQTFF